MARGTGGGAACDGLGFVSVKLKWPRGSDHELDQIGFEYRLVQGSLPEGVVPAGVVAAPVNGRRSEHLFTWQDQEPARQQPIHALLEVRAVTGDGHRGTGATGIAAIGRARSTRSQGLGGRVTAQAPRPRRVHCDAHGR